MKLIRLATYLLFAVVLTNCGEYQEVLKSKDLDYKFSKAVEYYDAGEYNKAYPIFDELKEKKVFKFNPGKCQKVLKKVVKKGTYYTGLTKPVYPPFYN